MTDAPSAKAGVIIWGKETVALQGTPLPVVYFDHAACLSLLNGIIGVTLTVSGNVPTEAGGADSVVSVAAHLKCNVPAAISLRDAINGALLLAQPVEKPEGQAN